MSKCMGCLAHVCVRIPFGFNDLVFHLYLTFQLSSLLLDAVAMSVMFGCISAVDLRFARATERLSRGTSV
jgi:hypothetical protein